MDPGVKIGDLDRPVVAAAHVVVAPPLSVDGDLQVRPDPLADLVRDRSHLCEEQDVLLVENVPSETKTDQRVGLPAPRDTLDQDVGILGHADDLLTLMDEIINLGKS
jgi:hypothetical protein